MYIAEHPKWKQANDTLKRLNRKGTTMPSPNTVTNLADSITAEMARQHAAWPSTKNLAEMVSVGCMICGAPGTSFNAIKRFLGEANGIINPDGTIDWGDIHGVDEYLYQIVCSECGEVVWQK